MHQWRREWNPISLSATTLDLSSIHLKIANGNRASLKLVCILSRYPSLFLQQVYLLVHSADTPSSYSNLIRRQHKADNGLQHGRNSPIYFICKMTFMPLASCYKIDHFLLHVEGFWIYYCHLARPSFLPRPTTCIFSNKKSVHYARILLVAMVASGYGSKSLSQDVSGRIW
ncbi:hypothetical protein LXL04_004572 [Taraxacum kok-saghyz]